MRYYSHLSALLVIATTALPLPADYPTVLRGGAPDPDGSPNFFVDLPSPVDFKSLSELAIRTFRQIYGMRHPGQLKYTAFSSGGAQIRLPTLRLKRRE